MANAIVNPVPASTVWIVDDSPLEAEVARRSLAHMYGVEVFHDGASFIEQIANATPPDAVILDWQMPEIDGLEVCRFLRSRPSTMNIPILVLTVHRQTAELVRCLAAGADDFVSKPFNAAELAARLGVLVRSKQLRERVESAERSLRQMLMELPEAVLSVAPGGGITFVNREAERMLGSPAIAILGRSLRSVLPALATAVEGGEPLPDLVLADRVFAPALRRYAGVSAADTTFSFRDVTVERQRAEERARLLAAERDAREQAEAANRAKDQFLAIVSHELRTPLNAILGWSRMLRNGTMSDDKRATAFEVLERNAAAQQRLVEDILDVSGILSGKLLVRFQETDAVALLAAAADAIRPVAAAKGVAFDDAIDPALPRMRGDPDRLRQIVSNLLSNAVKFTPAGGSVRLEASRDGDSIVIRVCDTGIGIDSTVLPHVFERFWQADVTTTRKHGGLGLGLSIVRHLVELHSGSVEARSDGPGKGATFVVRLPMDAIGTSKA